MSAELFFEIGVEELPPGFVKPACQHMESYMRIALAEDLRLDVDVLQWHVFGAPRRLVLSVQNLPITQATIEEEIIGPPASIAYDKEGTPTQAAAGFAKRHNLQVGDLSVQKTERGEYLCAKVVKTGQELSKLLPATLSGMLSKMPVPKYMKWGEGSFQFVRPVHWITAVFDDQILDFNFAGITAGEHSFGHRLVSPGKFKATTLSQYLSGCRRHKVRPHRTVTDDLKKLKGISMKSFKGRQQVIEESLEEIATDNNAIIFGSNENAFIDEVLRQHYYESLVQEVCQLTEYPVPVVGEFDKKYLNLPKEVILSELRDHQRCFAMHDAKGKLQPRFIAVSDNDNADVNVVRKGNERVIRARLSDASFFFESDRQTPLTELVEDLKGVIFHRQLGTMYEKITRITELAIFIGSKLDFCEPAAVNKGDEQFFLKQLPESTSLKARMKWMVGRTAMLAKTDLVSFMVGEFPELQGVMGREYALLSGEAKEIAAAIEEHYHPRFQGDTLPSNKIGDLVAIADKLDTVCGIIGIGKSPSGSADPFALRRAANGIMRICVEHSLDLKLTDLIEYAINLYQDKIETDRSQVLADVLSFFSERFRNWPYVKEQVSTEVINAVLAARFESPLDAYTRLQALSESYTKDGFEDVAATFKRVINILKEFNGQGQVKRNLFRSDQEGVLHASLSRLTNQIQDHLKTRTINAYRAILSDLAALKPDVDEFFEHVMVNCEEEDIRLNRHLLLKDIADLFGNFADISQLHVK